MAKSSPALSDVLDSLEKGEPAAAARLLDRLPGRPVPAPGSFPRLWEAFRALLRRRGYFVDDPVQLADSLHEIAELGEGFDLHDLARTLARYDAAVSDTARPRSPRRWPELKDFSNGLARRERKGESA